MFFYHHSVGIGPYVDYICPGHIYSARCIRRGGLSVESRQAPYLRLNISDPMATPTDTDWYYVTVYNIHQCHADDSIQINVQLPRHGCGARLSTIFASMALSILLHQVGSTICGHRLRGSLLLRCLIRPLDLTQLQSILSKFQMTASPPRLHCGRHSASASYCSTQAWTRPFFRNTSATLSGTTNGTIYYWYPDDYVLDPHSLTTPTTPLNTTTYYLYASSPFGCYNLDSVVVTVDPYTLLLVPSAFSPNGDGENDIFRIVRGI